MVDLRAKASIEAIVRIRFPCVDRSRGDAARMGMRKFATVLVKRRTVRGVQEDDIKLNLRFIAMYPF